MSLLWDIQTYIMMLELHQGGKIGCIMLDYFFELMDSNSIYLLDEPENCLSPVYQKKLRIIFRI